jgi:hypothetical protein
MEQISSQLPAPEPDGSRGSSPTPGSPPGSPAGWCGKGGLGASDILSAKRFDC